MVITNTEKRNWKQKTSFISYNWHNKINWKRVLSYWGKTNEAIYTLDNPTVDHGNFLEMILLMGKYDSVIKAHLDKAIQNSTKSYNSGSKQGGGYKFLIKNDSLLHYWNNKWNYKVINFWINHWS